MALEDAIEDNELAALPEPAKAQHVRSNTLAQNLQTDPSQSASWGDKHKAGAFKFVRDFAINFVLNAGLATFFAYGVENSKLGPKINKKIEDLSKGNDFKKFFWNFMIKTQLLLCGGHVLQPTLKWMKDNKNSIEAKYGDIIDRFQMSIGKGNETTKQNIEDYKRVRELIDIGKQNKGSNDLVSALGEKDKALVDKYNLSDKLEFNERKIPWGAVLKARLTGMSFTTLLSIGLVASSKLPEKYDKLKFRETYEKPWGEYIGDKVISKTPIINKAFKNHAQLAEILIDEAVYTAASDAGYALSEKAHDKRANKLEVQGKSAQVNWTSSTTKPQGDYRSQALAREENQASVTPSV